MLAGKAKVHERSRPGFICRRVYNAQRQSVEALVAGTVPGSEMQAEARVHSCTDPLLHAL